MEKTLYCVTYSGPLGFFRPYNSVRDGEPYSYTYIPTSVLDGIEKECELKCKIARHKLRFDTMCTDFRGGLDNMLPQRRHVLTNVEIVLGFENKEVRDDIAKLCIYAGQREYLLLPKSTAEMTESEFSELLGVETFETDKDNIEGVFCGFNRQRNNERMYVRIDRKEWKL